MNNVSTIYSGAVVRQNLTRVFLGCKQIINTDPPFVDKTLKIKK
ncbi:MAG: hypothetical protein WCG42_05350 [Parachlamydiaceae bacterium]